MGGELKISCGLVPLLAGRPIKFRIWLSGAQQWEAADADGSRCGHRCMHVEAGVYTLSSTEGAVLTQFTGLLDKNGKEIYEGDILWQSQEAQEWSMYSPMHGLVGWNEYQWMFINEVNNVGWNLSEKFASSQSEVIGNIFENPELLAPNVG